MNDEPRLPSRPATNSWELADVIDFESLLEQDRDSPKNVLLSRDRQIRNDLQTKLTTNTENRRVLFRGWLEARRAQRSHNEPSPGEISISAWRLALKVIAIAGTILGAGAAANLLSYDGEEPVNVAAYLGWLVLVQIGLVVAGLIVLVLRNTRILSTESSLLLALVRHLWSQLAVRLGKHAMSQVSANRRSQVAAFLGSTKGWQTLYGKVAVWPLAGSLQLFGICFNLAALMTTIALVIFSDRAFGWQSAVNFSSEQIHELVQTLAAPWSWALPDATPSLSAVEGSKIVLKSGIKQLATADLVSWWPFLCLSLAVYGLLPRVLLWLVTMALTRRALTNLSFNHVDCDRLYERLQRPELETSGDVDQPGPALPSPLTNTRPSTQFNRADSNSRNNAAILLMGEELKSQIDQEKLAVMLKDRFLLDLTEAIAWSDDSATIRQAIKEITSSGRSSRQPVVILLEEAWQPPIAEKLQGVRELRSHLGADAKLILVLVGRPDAAGPITRVKASDLKVWERQIQTLGDTRLRVETLINHE